eukprot:5004273-Alexandrium_andersonii.AAC.1
MCIRDSFVADLSEISSSGVRTSPDAQHRARVVLLIRRRELPCDHQQIPGSLPSVAAANQAMGFPRPAAVG